MEQQPHLLHVRPSFGRGGAEVRGTTIMNHFQARFRHTVAAVDGCYDAASLLEKSVPWARATVERTSNPAAMTWRFAGLLRQLRPDLILTYNWGSIDMISANLIQRTAPLIHTEDGFNQDELDIQKSRRALWRRAVLRHVFRVVAISRTLMGIMKDLWQIPAERVCFIPNGIDTDWFQPAPMEARTRKGPIVVGSVANLTAVKQQTLLLEACAAVMRQIPLRVVIAGDGPERNNLEQCAARLGIQEHVQFLGRQTDVRSLYHSFDLFALSSRTEQMPMSLLEAMASGLPVISTDVGDIASMVSPENREFVVTGSAAYENALGRLASEVGLRQALGEANRKNCLDGFSREKMLRRYEELYNQAIASKA